MKTERLNKQSISEEQEYSLVAFSSTSKFDSERKIGNGKYFFLDFLSQLFGHLSQNDGVTNVFGIQGEID
ncbi:MAG: hypothetical protein AAF600_08260 [Bacteroidota bacterium]